MFGNLQVRFLGGSGAARLPSYPVPLKKSMKAATVEALEDAITDKKMKLCYKEYR
jgi:hypothetical protein